MMEKNKSISLPMAKKKKAELVFELLKKRYPSLETHLHAKNPWELLIATILAAQCTDARVNMVTPELFKRWPSPAELAVADIADVEAVVRSTGFYRNKAKNIIKTATRVMSVYAGEVPSTMADLITLPGVARKTANVVLWGGFGINDGIAVDTHVGRIAYRLGLASGKDPVKTEKELMAIFKKSEWGEVNHMLVWFGRHVCDARKPLCEHCEFARFCNKQDVK